MMTSSPASLSATSLFFMVDGTYGIEGGGATVKVSNEYSLENIV